MNRPTWNLNRMVVLLLSGVYAGLVLDLRAEHIDVLRHHWTGWIPIVYCALAAAAGLTALLRWRPSSRRLFFWLSLCGIIVGLLGVWFHDRKDLAENFLEVIQAWWAPIHRNEGAPVLAPFALCGLGVLGMLACARRFQPERPNGKCI